MAPYTKLPSRAKVKPQPFQASVSEEKLSDFKQLIKLSPIGPAVYENKQEDRRFGMTRKWLTDAKQHWQSTYDWRATEKRINSFPNYTTPIKDDSGFEFNIHFIALFSDREDAIPIAFYHGWPGSFLEFLTFMDVIKDKYSPADLPYHIIVPSLPGYAYSSNLPLDVDFNGGDMPRIMNRLMIALGFGSGYVAQGGDLGSFVSQRSAEQFDECKVNMIMREPPKNADQLEVNELEKKALAKGQKWVEHGTAYAQEHGTRTATIGLVLSASPIAMLAWIGEKFLEWSDADPSMDEILDSVSLYWLTDTYPRSTYPYRGIFGPERADSSKNANAASDPPSDKPFGLSWFPDDLVSLPRSWIETYGNLVHFSQHTSGGHFAAMEKPHELLQDVEAFVKIAWKQ